MTTQQALDLAISHHEAGRLGDAQALYQKILAIEPKNGNVLHLLGLLVAQSGRPQDGLKLIQNVIAAHPNVALFHLNLGETHRRMGNHPLAIPSFRRAIELDPNLCLAHHNLSASLCETGEIQAAILSAKAALALNPEFAEAHFNLANALDADEETEAAIAEYRRAIELKPDYVDALNNLSVALYDEQLYDEAIEACHAAMRFDPKSSAAYNNLGAALDARGRPEEAIDAYAAAAQFDPNDPRAHANYGYALARKGRLDEGYAECEAALALNADYADAHCYQGFILNEKGLLDEALRSSHRAIELDPELAAAHNTLGNVLKDMGRIPQALAVYRQAAQFAPEACGFHSNLVYALYFDPDCAQSQLFKEHRLWSEQHEVPLKSSIVPHENSREPNRRLKIGYVSPDFRAHPVGRFILPLMAAHDHQNFEIFCYASVQKPDVVTPQIQKHADVWRDVRKLDNDELAEKIREDQIDILVDLTMHMGNNRLPLFARKPAPVQVTYLAYAGTTGLDAIDYRLTDPHLDPPGMTQEFYSEKTIHLAQSYWCYRPPIDDLELTPLPADASGFITFGCLNNFCKNSTATLETWAKLLALVPNSRLLLHASPGSHRGATSRKFVDSGINPARLMFIEKLSLPKYMEQYSRIDIALDPFPYVGGTTTCDALWMGVPVVTLAGQTAVSRGGVSILSNIGSPEWIAEPTEQYVQIVASLANDLSGLREIRATLRERMRGSPLMDAKRFARDMEAVFQRMWGEFISTADAKK